MLVETTMNGITNAYLLFTITSARTIIRSDVTDSWPGLNVLVIKIASFTYVSFSSKTIKGKNMKISKKIQINKKLRFHTLKVRFPINIARYSLS